ncbi:hypothetical protein BDR22DRAFT_893275 [Usnea florida]
MGDPFSVAGSAVGVVSLAITTCQGVISYYNSWDNQDQSIIDAKGKIERLHSSLSALDEILPKISSSSGIAAEVEQCVLSCRECTARLQNFLGKCRENAVPLNFRERLRDCRQRAIFPFRQSSLDSLNEIVRDLEKNLCTALQVLQLDTSEAQIRQTSDLVDLTKSTAVSVEGANRCISNVEQKVDQVLVALSQIQLGVAQYASHGPILRSSFRDMERRTQAIESFTSQILPDLHDKLDQLPVRIQESRAGSTATAGACPSVEPPGLNSGDAAISKHLTGMDEDARRLQLVLAQRPSLLRTVCDEVSDLDMDLGQTSMMTAQDPSRLDPRIWKRTKQRSYCSCATLTRRKAATYSIGRVDFFKTFVESSSHSVTCPLYIRTEATTTVGLKMVYYGRLLANTVRATVSIATGAGGYSINPSLKFHAVVTDDSPGFRLLQTENFKERCRTTPAPQSKAVSDYFESALQQLYELFKDGRASPTDVNVYGMNLLHKFCKMADFLSDYLDAEALQSCYTLLKGLIAAGVPLNEPDIWGQSVFDCLARFYVQGHRRKRRLEHGHNLVELCTVMSIAGAESLGYDPVRGGWHVSQRVRELNIFTTLDGLIDGPTYGVLGAAIFHRSESEIKRILQNSPQSIHEQHSRGQTPLHLSCSWPKGIILLFHHGGLELVHRGDDQGTLPLAYACLMRCSEAVRLILETDSALLSPHTAVIAQSTADLGDYHDTPDEMRSHLQNALVDRRRRLMSLAITHLCPKDLEDLRVTDDRLLDEKAFDVYKALECENVVISSALRVPFQQTTVFHYDSLTPAIGESLYRCGFMDIDGIDNHGLTPMMRTPLEATFNIEPTLQRASWLISKGADPGRRVKPHENRPASTAAHYMCSWVGRAIHSTFTEKIDRTWLSDDVTKEICCTSSYSNVTEKVDRAWLFRIFEQLGNDCRALLEAMLSSEFYDCCLCACSSQGCTPAIMMLKKDNVSSLELHSLMIEWFTTMLENRHEVWQWLSQEIIRYETFEKLELTHTCCLIACCGGPRYFNFFCTRYDSMEREEIHDEERLLISKLETLVAEFSQKYTELGVSLPDFLKGYWKTRMEEIEKEEEALDDEEIAKIEELGVVIHS